MTEYKDKIERLVNIVRHLRSPEGCPWDRKQDHVTLKPMLVEETAELLDAIDVNDAENIKEELGDILMHIVFHSIMAEEKGKFTFSDVIDNISEKMEHRHPHIFGERDKTRSADDVVELWQQIKAEERKKARKKETILGRIPKNLSALLRAEIVQKKIAETGFDWNNIADVLAKIEEELKELKKAIAQKNDKNIDEEIGDLLFSIVNYCRFRRAASAEQLLQHATDKFVNRFNAIENKVKKSKKAFSEYSLKELDLLWEKTKKLELTN
jgi:MazG family protein